MDCETATRKRKAVAAILILESLEDDEGRTWKRGKTRNWIKRRDELGHFNTIIQELRMEDMPAYKEMMRMEHAQVLETLSLIEKDITPQKIFGGNKIICPLARLTLALRFLATGETYRSLSFQFRISKAAVSYIVKEVCTAIIKNMAPLYLKTPKSQEEWEGIAQNFEKKWQFPNCIGAIDGKHLVMQPPPEAASKYYNYKHTHSIILLAVVGPNYECIYADVGTIGRVSDGGVWSKCNLARKIENDPNFLPPSRCLPSGSDEVLAVSKYLTGLYILSLLLENKG
eukprot:Seg788.16 transcript_id=Seg788.16/GoldUCD/mRNA.D3Y31 product="Protein ALP1-like" protein_id=Seg788.16/GoldUCD/D3Y31